MKSKQSYLGILFLIMCLISVPDNLFAQVQNTVSGKVFDDSGATIPGANVSIKETGKGTITDENGGYSFSNIAAGTYTIIATNVGYKTFEKKISVKEGESVVADLLLEGESQSLKEVVVTGSSSPRSKLESSVAITTMGAKAIEDRAPSSTAALLQTIPGFVVEASGGEIGNNLFARGIPSAGAYEYVQIQEDGLPVFEDGALQFANVDTFYRLDETVSKMEAVRGGSASIFANNAPGGIINFISKTGQNEFMGRAKFTTSDYGMFRTDLNLSGALIQDKLFFNVGGFYRVDNGVRNTGFTANKGGQIKGNITYKFDDSDYLRVNFKHLDDRNTFYLPIPLKSNNGKIEGIDGFNPNYGTLTSVNFSHLNVPQYGGGTFSADLEDGSHPIIKSIGAEFKKKISEKVTFKNAFKQTNIDLNYNAIFPNGGPWTQDAYATGVQNTTASNLTYSYVDNGQTLDQNALIMRADLWHIEKKMNNFANNFSFSFDLDPVQLTAGYYYSNWKSNQYWNWNSYLVGVSDNPRLLNVKDNTTGVDHTWNGVERITWLERDAQTKGILNDIYADAEIKATDNLTFNAGLRYNKDKYSGYRDNARFFAEDLGILDNNTADDAVTTVKGNPYAYWRYDVSEWSYTAAGNYKFNDNMASYVRYSHGFRSPIEESFYDNAADLSKLENTEVNQFELGYKYSNSFFSVNANLFHMNLKNVAFTDILSDGSSENKFADVNNIGLEVETNARYEMVKLNFTFTVQKPEYDNFTGTNADGSAFDFNGNTARRIPKFFCNLRPEVDITKDFTAYVQFSYYDKKFTNQDNRQVLPAYKEVGAGLNYTYNNLRFAVDASNLFNEIGLTEGDPRQTTAAASDVFMARPILGRAFRFSVAINF
ncbi:TonB-dependent receptor [Flavobacterium sp. Root420]|uniref:TonB-dependent receptor n=1 Tax=Flavobacterium sp. Root420 TaxID=1736533 RepID=UPI0006FC3721|nr:TonB-dependent receptor [Flavobacterium sp. Root420]KQX08798.1 TonB-dependent receptor [Flavobacterium sp. Root420]